MKVPNPNHEATREIPHPFTFFKKIYLFLEVLGLRCWVQASSSCSEQGLLFVAEWGLLFVAVRRLLIVVASLVAEHGLQVCRLQ